MFSHCFTSLWGPLLSGFGSRPCDFHNRKRSMSFNTQGHLIILIKLSGGCHVKVQSLLVSQFSSTSKSMFPSMYFSRFQDWIWEIEIKLKILAELSFVVIMHFSIKYFALELFFFHVYRYVAKIVQSVILHPQVPLPPVVLSYHSTCVKTKKPTVIHHY